MLQRILQFIFRNDIAIINNKIDIIMSAIKEFAERQHEFNDRIDAAIEGLTGDVQHLHETIEKLQNNPGPITPEDQALLDDLDARVDVITQKLEALDALTPPAIPDDNE